MSAWASLFSSPTAAFTLQAQLAAQPLLHMPANYSQQQVQGLGRGRPPMTRGGAAADHMPMQQRGGYRGGMQRGGMRGGRGGGAHGQKRARDDGTNAAATHKRAAHVRPPSPPPPPPVALTPEEAADVAAWIAERKSKYPTRAALEAKEAEYLAAVARGEVQPRPQRGRRRERGERRNERGGRGGAGAGVRGGRTRTPISLPLVPQGERSDYEDEPSSDDEYNNEQPSTFMQRPHSSSSASAPSTKLAGATASVSPTAPVVTVPTVPSSTLGAVAQAKTPSTAVALLTDTAPSADSAQPMPIVPAALPPLSAPAGSMVLRVIRFLVQRLPTTAVDNQ